MALARTLLALFVALLLPSSSSADYFSLELPELVGEVPTYGTSVELHFDFGREFLRVDRVLLVMTAEEAVPLQLEHCGSNSRPAPCELSTQSPGFFIQLAGPGLNGTQTSIQGLRTYPKSFAGVLERSFGDFSFRHLRDGRGVLTFGWNQQFFVPEEFVRLVTAPEATVHRIELLVEAVPREAPTTVPEASHVLSSFSALLALHLVHRQRSRIRPNEPLRRARLSRRRTRNPSA